MKDYLIGTKDSCMVFPTISKIGKVCKAKLIKFDPQACKKKRLHSLEAKLKEAVKLQADFETDKDVFFGEHLCSKYPALPIAIVESEKTALIASLCKGAFPFDFVWLASGSKQWLKPERIKRLGRFDKWQAIASDARSIGLTVNVSNVLEKRAKDAEKAKQVDLADYLIGLQSEINRINERLQNDHQSMNDFSEIVEERKAILILDGGLSETDAEAYVSTPGFNRETIQSIFHLKL